MSRVASVPMFIVVRDRREPYAPEVTREYLIAQLTVPTSQWSPDKSAALRFDHAGALRAVAREFDGAAMEAA